MDDLIARPRMLKQVNLSSIRRVIKNKGTATRAEIAMETQISSTTVRSLLTEMQNNGEIISIGYDESSGGRKAERYRFKMDRYYGVAFCTTQNMIHYLVVDIFGGIVEKGKLHVRKGNLKEALLRFLDYLVAREEIKSIGIGVPGVVDGGSYLRKNQQNDEYIKVDIAGFLAQRYGVPVILENDINAITIGFARCYEKQLPDYNSENTNIAFVFFERECISCGFIAGGRIIRGWNNYSGELSTIPSEGQKSLVELMAEPMDNARYTALVVKIICWICAILNPQIIALGGPNFRKKCTRQISNSLHILLPDKMSAEILHSPDIWHDYYEGMAFLTAGKIFNDVQFIKE